MQDRTGSGANAAATIRLASAGFVATAVAFGPARMGFGLFLPEFRDDFSLSTTLAGLVASGGFLAFLLALPLAAWISARMGQRTPVMAGALSATAGFALVAVASNIILLAAGIALAGASAGFCWAPFNDAAERVVPVNSRAGALSAVSTGTTIGVAAAGALALFVGAGVMGWRTAWGVFALAGVVAALGALFGVPGGHDGPPDRDPTPGLLRRDTVPLHGAALLYGATNAVYLSFAADRVATAGGLPGMPDAAAAAAIFLGYGICGLVGLATGRIETRIGLTNLLAVIFAAFALSMVLIALTPRSWPGILVSSGLHGAAVMMISAVVSFWSLRLFPGHASLGFTAALVAVAIGSVIGPPIAGVLLDMVGPLPGFLILAFPAAAMTIGLLVRPGPAPG